MVSENKVISIDYETLVDAYNERLLTQLRGHGVEYEFLELWVPDEDHFSSIVNMIEAAESFGETGFELRLRAETLSQDEYGKIVGLLGPGIMTSSQISEEGRILRVAFNAD